MKSKYSLNFESESMWFWEFLQDFDHGLSKYEFHQNINQQIWYLWLLGLTMFKLTWLLILSTVAAHIVSFVVFGYSRILLNELKIGPIFLLVKSFPNSIFMLFICVQDWLQFSPRQIVKSLIWNSTGRNTEPCGIPKFTSTNSYFISRLLFFN